MSDPINAFFLTTSSESEVGIIIAIITLISTIIGLWIKTARAISSNQELNSSTLEKLSNVIEALEVNARRQTRLLERIDDAQKRIERDIEDITKRNPCVFSDISSAKALTDTIADEVSSKLK